MKQSRRNTLKLAILAGAVLAANVFSASAIDINLYVDAAPNAFGSPAYAPWLANAKATAANGTFVNMANSTDPANAGTTSFSIADVSVYSFGDLGRRLHFVYYVPGQTIASLTALNFQVALTYEWDGVTYDFYNDNYGSTWLTPGSWVEYNGGVFGTAGFAWWAAYGVNTPEALQNDLDNWDPYQGDITFYARVDGQVESLTAHHGVPDGGVTSILLGCGLAVIGSFRRWISR